MIRALTLSLGQLGDPAIVRILVRSLLVTLLVFVVLGVALGYALRGFDPCALVADDTCPLDASGSGLGAAVLTVAGLWLLFPAVAIGVISGFMDRIVAAVERRHYPAAAQAARPLGLGRGLLLGLRSSSRLLLYNSIALPFYILLLVTGIGTVILFVAVNGMALGRDLGEMVSARHLAGAVRRVWLQRTRAERAVLGMLATTLFLVPLVNLLAPVLAAAMATHLFHATRDELTPRA
jgi:CysZ protein